MYMKLGILALVISAIGINHYPIPKQTTLTTTPIALVKYQDTVYQCQGVVSTVCGYSIHCGKLSVHCASDLVIEYIN